jgi:hypothetical protein
VLATFLTTNLNGLFNSWPDGLPVAKAPAYKIFPAACSSTKPCVRTYLHQRPLVRLVSCITTLGMCTLACCVSLWTVAASMLMCAQHVPVAEVCLAIRKCETADHAVTIEWLVYPCAEDF